MAIINIFKSRNLHSDISSKFLHAMLIICAIIAIALSKINPTTATLEKICKETCYSSYCYSEARYFESILNFDADPCENFYEFVCGNFAHQPSKSEKAKDIAGTLEITQSKVDNDVFAEILKIQPTDLRAFNTIKTYYENCINEERINEESIEPVRNILEKIGGWPVALGERWNERNFNWIATVSKLSEFSEIFFPFVPVVQIDLSNPAKFLILINHDLTPNLLNQTNQQILRAYYDLILNISMTFGAVNNYDTFFEINKIIDFELQLLNISSLADQAGIQNRFSSRELRDRFPTIPWQSLLNKIFEPAGVTVDDTTNFYIDSPQFFLELELILRKIPKRVLANYLAWNFVYSTLPYMPDRLRLKYLNYRHILTRDIVKSDRTSWCKDKLVSDKGLSTSLSALYIKRYFDKEVNDNIIEMFKNIKNQLKRRFKQIDWMDVMTRNAALDKLEAMNATIGFDEQLINDDKIEEYYRPLEVASTESYFHSATKLKLFSVRQNYKLLVKPVNTNKWMYSLNIADINGYSVPVANKILIFTGIINNLFKTDGLQYLNYGKLGAFIGHEIVHGFDAYGKGFDKHGNQLNWWHTYTERKFQEKANCFVEQYSNFTFEEVNLQVNGTLTLDENIADNGGFKAAYNAYVDLTQRLKLTEECLPALSYTPRQMFWISAASMWCSNPTPEYLRELINKMDHSPRRARVTVSFSNMEEFARDFECKAGTRMNPRKKCVLW